MITLLSVFLLGFIFSFIGSIPPGSINVTVLQYALVGKKKSGMMFLIAAALTEYIYAAIAVKFQLYLSVNVLLNGYLQIISGSVLIILGAINLLKKVKPTRQMELKEKRNAFKKGILLSLSNPLAIPFWLMVTAYLQSTEWLHLTDQSLWVYLSGISTGTFLLLYLILHVGVKYVRIRQNSLLIYRLPGVLFLLMGIWSFL